MRHEERIDDIRKGHPQLADAMERVIQKVRTYDPGWHPTNYSDWMLLTAAGKIIAEPERGKIEWGQTQPIDDLRTDTLF